MKKPKSPPSSKDPQFGHISRANKPNYLLGKHFGIPPSASNTEDSNSEDDLSTWRAPLKGYNVANAPPPAPGRKLASISQFVSFCRPYNRYLSFVSDLLFASLFAFAVACLGVVPLPPHRLQWLAVVRRSRRIAAVEGVQ